MVLTDFGNAMIGGTLPRGALWAGGAAVGSGALSQGLRSGQSQQMLRTLAPELETRLPTLSAPGSGALAQEIRLTQAQYDAALRLVFPSQYLNQMARLVDSIGERAAERAANNPQFVQAVQSGNWKLAGTLFHSAAAQEARLMPAWALPPGWTLEAERYIQRGAGGSRLDLLLRGLGAEVLEFDWKTTGRSALSTNSIEEMKRHAAQITTNKIGTLTIQESRSWVDYVRPLLPGVQWLF